MADGVNGYPAPPVSTGALCTRPAALIYRLMPRLPAQAAAALADTNASGCCARWMNTGTGSTGSATATVTGGKQTNSSRAQQQHGFCLCAVWSLSLHPPAPNLSPEMNDCAGVTGATGTGTGTAGAGTTTGTRAAGIARAHAAETGGAPSKQQPLALMPWTHGTMQLLLCAHTAPSRLCGGWCSRHA